jgi:5-(carboxyamino)imidazole ribonucleotide synthase
LKYHLGFLGGGQLARMSIQAAQRMGLRCVSLDSSEKSPAAKVADFRVGSITRSEDIQAIFEIAEKVTLENEFIPADVIRSALEGGGHSEDRLIPGLAALATIQDKLVQRQALLNAGVPCPHAVALDDKAAAEIGFPMVLKTRFGGYDGKGTRYAKNSDELAAFEPEWSRGGWLAEQFVSFRREIAVMVVVGPNGSFCFPTVETVQTNSVCDLVFPCDADASLIAIDAVRAVGGIGLFGVELFELSDGRILVNEIAPRPHNSGHYTLDWGGPSQFEYHVRAVLDLPMTKPDSCRFAVMANLLGQPGAGEFEPALAAALAEPGAFVHWYEKDESKPGRKMGHINVCGDDFSRVQEAVDAAKLARSRFYQAWTKD